MLGVQFPCYVYGLKTSQILYTSGLPSCANAQLNKKNPSLQHSWDMSDARQPNYCQKHLMPR